MEIRSTELRIGNVVRYNGICKITANDIFEMAEFEKRTGMADNLWEAEPFSEEWLPEFGFKLEVENEKFKCYSNGTMKVYFGAKDFYDMELNCMPKFILNIKNLTFVHEFQNLYFGLLREELPITLKAE